MKRLAKIEIRSANNALGNEEKRQLGHDEEAGAESALEVNNLSISAEKAFLGNEYLKAAKYYSQVLTQSPYCEKAWVGLALCLAEQDRIKRMGRVIKEYEKVFNRSPRLLAVKGLYNTLKGRCRIGVALSDMAIENRPKDALLWYIRGRIYWVKKVFDKAEAFFEKALICEPANWRLRVMIANLYYKKRAWEKAYTWIKSDSIAIMNWPFYAWLVNKVEKRRRRRQYLNARSTRVP